MTKASVYKDSNSKYMCTKQQSFKIHKANFDDTEKETTIEK